MISNLRGRLLASTLIVGALCGTTPLLAQAPAADAAAPEAESIVVTGSRIARPEADASTPLAVIGAAQIQGQGITNVQDLAQKLPQVGVPGLSRTNSNFLTTGNGVSTVNLRNLGDDRTLVLVNGRRFVPGIAGTARVDVNNIPVDFVDRVEVVTGGASAIYGSDAIAGVVNYVLKDHIDGITGRAQYGISEQGDNRNYTASIAGGLSFGPDRRGSVMANFTYSKDAGLMSRDRAISRYDCLYTCGPESFSSFPAQGRFVLQGENPAILPTGDGDVTDTFTFNPNNSVVNGFPVGYGYNRNGARRISVPLERFLGALNAKYEVNDHITAFFEGTYSKVKSSSQIEANPFGAGDGIPQPNLPFGYSIDNPFIPAPIAAAIQAANSDGDPTNDITSISFARRQNEVYTRSNRNTRETFRVVAGLRGDITDKWNYEISANYGRLKDHTSTEDVDLTKYANALDAIRDPSGTIVCRDPAARAAGCVPINLFGYNTASPAASAYVLSAQPRSDRITNTQFVADANVSGTLFALPYGDLKVAVGGEYRREKSVDDWDDLTNQGLNSGNQTPDTIGKFNVKEVYGEVDIPLLADLPFVHSLSAQGAIRYSDYSTVGSVLSWNAGGEYSPFDGLRFRGNYAVANRAPNIAELFSAPSETFPTGLQDPCNGATTATVSDACRAIPAVAQAISNGGTFRYTQAAIQGINGFDGGNINLHEETGKTLTLGAVITPSALRGLTFTVDYFHINVDGMIDIVDRQTSISECLNTGLPQFCDNVIRDPRTGFITTVNAQLINIAAMKTSGIDFDLRYGRRLGLFGNDRLDAILHYTRTLKYKRQSDPAAPLNSGLGNQLYGLNNAAIFRDKANAQFIYSAGPISLNWTVTYLGKITNTPTDEFDPQGTYDFLIGEGLTPEQARIAVSHNNIKARVYNDVQVRARIGDRKEFEIYLGVDNLFNRKPPILEDGLFVGSVTGTTTAADVYDPIGRRFYMGVQVHF